MTTTQALLVGFGIVLVAVVVLVLAVLVHGSDGDRRDRG